MGQAIDICGSNHVEMAMAYQIMGFIRPRLIIQPFEMIEGGLSHVEERALMEMGQIAGARKVKIYIGEKLTPEMFDVVFRRS